MITQNMSSGSGGGNRSNRGDANVGSNELIMQQMR